MERLISKYKHARKRRHNLFLEYETMLRRKDVLCSKYKEKKVQVTEAEKRIQVL